MANQILQMYCGSSMEKPQTLYQLQWACIWCIRKKSFMAWFFFIISPQRFWQDGSELNIFFSASAVVSDVSSALKWSCRDVVHMWHTYPLLPSLEDHGMGSDLNHQSMNCWRTLGRALSLPLSIWIRRQMLVFTPDTWTIMIKTFMYSWGATI